MKHLMIASAILALLAACGSGGSRYSSGNSTRGPVPAVGTEMPVLFASGPISQACLSAGRRAASRARCGCVQAVADFNLSPAEQRRGAAFFDDPQQAQDIRQSDNSANEVFWKKWKAYGQEAAQLCARA